MYQSAVEQTFSTYAYAIDAVDLTHRAVLQASRSWVKAAEQALPFPSDQPGPWTLADVALDSGVLYATARTRYAQSLLEAAAQAMGALGAPSTPPAPSETVAKSPSSTPSAPSETVAEAPPAPKPARRAAAKSPAPTTRSNAKGASPRRPSAS